jgi:hypothetical protein
MLQGKKMDTTFATIISLLPFDLVELKPGLNPNEYTINKAVGDKFGLTIIPNDIYYLINPDPLADAKNTRNIKVPVPAIELARGIINDYISALLAVNPPEAIPGLIAVRGDYTDRKEIVSKFMKEISIARTAQNKWFENLVFIADDLWSKTKSPISISDLQRSAAKWLGITRDWVSPIPQELIEKCPICKNAINPGALKCVVCNTVLNKKAYEEALAAIK